ncbi:MAG: hypothetical protein HRU80_07360 [Ignavibacteriales bacterium]|nr:MAG: hypothetical protein HRU80_07360 [Ignavibacteriales bacterium]
MKIDNTSLFFNSSIKDATATAAWGTSVGQSKKNGYKLDTDKEGLKDVIYGMTYNIKPADSLKATEMSENRELLYCSIFSKVFVNGIELKEESLIFLLVKEHTESHNGRIIISYPPYAEYATEEKALNNAEVYRKMGEALGCPNGCWFAFEINVRNQEELHFSAIVVSDTHTEYDSSAIRKIEWNNLVENKLQGNIKKTPLSIPKIIESITATNLIYSPEIITRFIAALLTKPFIILTGLSGSGKTKLAHSIVKLFCSSSEQYKLVPVGADWTSREPMLGFPDSIEKNRYIKPESGVLQLIIEANKAKNQDKPFFLILDEMNLSHVERYFADFLSAMESGDKIYLHDDTEGKDDIAPFIRFPKNLFIIGTVNIDETTYMFSPKVLDRANVIEFRVSKSDMSKFLSNNTIINDDGIEGLEAGMAGDFLDLAQKKDLKYGNTTIIGELVLFFDELKKVGAEFGYRTATEIKRFTAFAKMLNNEWSDEKIFDYAIMQKLLPKVHGSQRKLKDPLKKMAEFCMKDNKSPENFLNKEAKLDLETNDNINDVRYPVTLEKIVRMYHNLLHNGFTSYAEN